MKMVIVSVYDVAAQAYGRPVFAVSVGAAMRSFTDEVNRRGEDNTMYQHAEDFLLFELGVFDDSNGSCKMLDVPSRS